MIRFLLCAVLAIVSACVFVDDAQAQTRGRVRGWLRSRPVYRPLRNVLPRATRPRTGAPACKSCASASAAPLHKAANCGCTNCDCGELCNGVCVVAPLATNATATTTIDITPTTEETRANDVPTFVVGTPPDQQSYYARIAAETKSIKESAQTETSEPPTLHPVFDSVERVFSDAPEPPKE